MPRVQHRDTQVGSVSPVSVRTGRGRGAVKDQEYEDRRGWEEGKAGQDMSKGGNKRSSPGGVAKSLFHTET